MNLISNDYLMHHGVKGMKWGVRRYQNKDGSLTNLGKSRYNYGDITVEKTNFKDVDSYYISNKDKKAEITAKSLREYEHSIDDAVVNYIASTNNIKVKKVIKDLDKKPELAKQANALIDSYMNQTLTKVLETVGEDKVKKPKPKYTSEQAIAKGYKDLEKKYPNFNSFSQDKQDKLWIDYMNKSGLYKYT